MRKLSAASLIVVSENAMPASRSGEVLVTSFLCRLLRRLSSLLFSKCSPLAEFDVIGGGGGRCERCSLDDIMLAYVEE